MEETWKDIEEFIGRYQISNLGNVRSCGFYNPHPKNPSYTCYRAGIILKKTVNIDGYHTVCLYDNIAKKGRTRRICRLVAMAFVVNDRPEATEVNHKDGNKQNDITENLEWATRSENEQHAYDTGLAKPHHTPIKLTEDMVHQIRKLAEDRTYPQYKIATMFGITQSNVSGILHRNYWGHI